MKISEKKIALEDEGSIEQLVNATTHNVATAITAMADGNTPKALHIAVSAASGIMQIMAQIMGRTGKDDDGTNLDEESIKGRINNQALMFAAQLMASAVSNTGTHVSVKASPATIYRALVNYEKITGEKPDDYLDSMMVNAGRTAGATPDIEAIESLQFAAGSATKH